MRTKILKEDASTEGRRLGSPHFSEPKGYEPLLRSEIESSTFRSTLKDRQLEIFRLKSCVDGNRRDLARAHRLARRAVWLCRLFPTEYAFALREYGQLLAQQGKHKRAAKVLEKSCGVAARQDATFELAQSNLALARVKVGMGSLGADEELARAEAEMKHFHDLIDKGLKNLKTIA